LTEGLETGVRGKPETLSGISKMGSKGEPIEMGRRPLAAGYLSAAYSTPVKLTSSEPSGGGKVSFLRIWWL